MPKIIIEPKRPETDIIETPIAEPKAPPVVPAQSRPLKFKNSMSEEEKIKFCDLLKLHGKNFEVIAQSLPRRTPDQCKNYFANFKKKRNLEAYLPDYQPGEAPKRKRLDSNCMLGKRKIPDMFHHEKPNQISQVLDIKVF